MTSTKTITLPDRITHSQFGCSEAFFNAKVKGHALPVTGVFKDFQIVEIDGHTFHIHESDLLPDGHDDQDKQARWEKARNAGKENENDW